MKKALIIFILTLLSAGIIFSADNSKVNAEETNDHLEIESLVVSGDDVYFEISSGSLEEVIIEYSYFKEDILFSKLNRLNVTKTSIDVETGFSNYYFKLPAETLSFKIWRIATSSTLRSTINGEYIDSESNALSQVEVRIKQLVVDNDLITKEHIYTDNIASKGFKFVMHFDLVDEEGNIIDIDKITRLSVRYDVIINNRSPVEENLTIEELTYRPMVSFPYFIPERVQQNIDESFDDNYTWMVDLGSYKAPHIPFIAPGNIEIDKTQLLTIDYVYDRVFYEDEIVIDEPYDKDDVIHVNPGTTDPYTSIWDKLGNALNNIGSTLELVMYVAIGIIAILILGLVFKIFSFIKGFIVTIYKAVKMVFKTIIGVIKLLFVSSKAKKRKEQYYVNRRI